MKRLVTATALLAATGLAWGAGATAASASPVAGSHGSTTHALIPQPGGPVDRAAGHAGLGIPTISLNWSGYAATSKKPFTYVHSTWVQPAIRCIGVANQWTSNWVGLDGFTDGTVEQDGTAANCGGPDHLNPNYVAWYEMYPAGSVNVFHVHPGDVMNASVSYASGMFTLTISDLTTGKTGTISRACSACARSSAEVVIERPALCEHGLSNCFLTELADFHSTVMGGDEASVNGGPVEGLGHFIDYPIYMIDLLKSGFISLDSVSALQSQGFTTAWNRSGSITPITLGPKK